ncbi:MAG: flagellar hook-length control protein FliK [Syntrophaceae bacterium]|nr:flagellar hook-length control protein FliK [Syntrophaceae bacterium]
MKLISLTDPSTQPVLPANRTRAVNPPSLSMGERVEAIVLEVRERGLLLLELGNTRVLAETRQPMSEGARFTARVVQNSPQIVLRILADDQPGMQEGLPESLIMFRSRPGLMEDMFRQLSALVDSMAETLPAEQFPLVAAARNGLQGLLASLIFSGSGTQDLDGIPEAPARPEAPAGDGGNSAARFSGGDDPAKASAGTLRESLLRLAVVVEEKLAAMDAGAPGRKDLEHAATTVRSALETLDVQRDVNILSRREGGPVVIQMPAAFPGGIRVQDLFIYPEGGQDGGDGTTEESFRVVLCLNMEMLGDILVDARMSGGRMTGSLRCGTEETRDLLQSGVDDLKERLAAAGFPDAGIVFLTDHDIAGTILERKHSLPLFQRDAVNVYA